MSNEQHIPLTLQLHNDRLQTGHQVFITFSSGVTEAENIVVIIMENRVNRECVNNLSYFISAEVQSSVH